MTKWRTDIENMPKDGTSVIADGPTFGGEDGGDRREETTQVVSWCDDKWLVDKPGDYYQTWIEPVRWAPLPEGDE
jgi:hypothetical protein